MGGLRPHANKKPIAWMFKTYNGLESLENRSRHTKIQHHRAGKTGGRHTRNRKDKETKEGGRRGGVEAVGKPGSVLPRGSHGHLSGTTVAGRLERPTRRLGEQPLAPPYLDLLRMGFAVPVVSPRPRWALTLRPKWPPPFHPYLWAPALPQVAPSAVCFLWHFPWGCPHWPLASILLCGARTFLHAPKGTQRPCFGLQPVPWLKPSIPSDGMGEFTTRPFNDMSSTVTLQH